MSTKKQTTKSEIVFDSSKIVLKSVYDKAGLEYCIYPCKDKSGRYPDCVKRVDSNGDMILSEKEKNAMSEGEAYYIGENEYFIIQHGKTFDLTNIQERAEWEAIKNCPLIAKDRSERDANGNYVIDGAIPTPRVLENGMNGGRSGKAELYIDHPGLDTQRKVTRKQLVHKAETYIFNDERGEEGRLNKVKLLGKNMYNQPSADVLDYLLEVASENPKKIIDLYTGTDTTLRLMFIDAKEKKVIYIKNKLYLYGDNIVLGATDDAVIAWMREPKNARVLELIKKDTYPDLYPIEDLQENK